MHTVPSKARIERERKRGSCACPDSVLWSWLFASGLESRIDRVKRLLRQNLGSLSFLLKILFIVFSLSVEPGRELAGRFATRVDIDLCSGIDGARATSPKTRGGKREREMLEERRGKETLRFCASSQKLARFKGA
jgi:hypothetical protein